MDFDLEIELRMNLRRRPLKLHVLNTNEGMVLAFNYPYHGDRVIKVPSEMEGAILELYRIIN